MSMFPIYLTLKNTRSRSQTQSTQMRRSRSLKSSSLLSSCKSKGAVTTTGTIHSLFSIAALTYAVEDASLTIKHSVDARMTAAVTSITTCSSVLIVAIVVDSISTYPISSVVTAREIVAVDPTMVTIVSQAIVVLVMFILK
jgi:hypothetical protein